ncbi:MAG: lytic transglycosylase domain-containing protein, partial [Acidimicrobiia bacterium]
PFFERYAREAGIRPELAMAVAWQESGWQTSITSWTGAVGVMQLMPDTTTFVSKVLLGRKVALDPSDPASNIRMGTRFLRYLLDRAGNNLETALASYYQGLRSVRERGPFAETKRFVANVLALQRRF